MLNFNGKRILLKLVGSFRFEEIHFSSLFKSSWTFFPIPVTKRLAKSWSSGLLKRSSSTSPLQDVVQAMVDIANQHCSCFNGSSKVPRALATDRDKVINIRMLIPIRKVNLRQEEIKWMVVGSNPGAGTILFSREISVKVYL